MAQANPPQVVQDSQGNYLILQPRNQWRMRPKTTYRYNRTTGKVEPVYSREVEYDPASMYRQATGDEAYQLDTQTNTQRMSTYVPPSERRLPARGSRTGYPTRGFGATGTGAAYPGRTFGSMGTLQDVSKDEQGNYYVEPPRSTAGTKISNAALGKPASPTDYWPAPGEPGAPKYYAKDPNNRLSKLGGGWFLPNGTRLPGYSPEMAQQVSANRRVLASGGGGTAGTTGGGGGEDGLTPEESARLEEAIMRLESGRGAEWTGRMGELALESAEHPGMTDAEREAEYKRLNREEIVPGFAGERFAVASAGGPGVRQELGALRVGETGARMKLGSQLAEEQLRTQRQERQQAIGTLGSAAEIERAYGGDVISSLLRYGTTPGHGTAGYATGLAPSGGFGEDIARTGFTPLSTGGVSRPRGFAAGRLPSSRGGRYLRNPTRPKRGGRTPSLLGR